MQARQAVEEKAERERQRTLAAALQAEEHQVRAEEAVRVARANQRLSAQRRADRLAQAARDRRADALAAKRAADDRRRATEEARRLRRQAGQEEARFRKAEEAERKRWQRADEKATQAEAAADRDVLAVAGQYNQGLGSTSRGSLRLRPDGDGGLNFFVDIRDTERGRGLLETVSSTDVFGRPYLDQGASIFSINGQTAVYRGAILSALVLGPSDQNRGWEPLREIDPDEEEEETDPTAEGRHIIIPPHVEQRRRLWL